MSEKCEMQPKSVLALAILSSIILGGVAHAATGFSLSGDFSNTLNPNGNWSYLYAGNSLPHQITNTTGNSLYPAVSPAGYFSTGNDLDVNTPDVLKTTIDGSQTYGAQGPFTNSDFLTGDVLIHSPNDGTALSIIWTAPSAGTIDFTGDVWYADSMFSRSNDVSVSLGSSVLGSAVVAYDSYSGRSTPWAISGTDLSVTKGETLVFDFLKSDGQPFGSLDGVAIDGTFAAAVPEPATWAMMLVGFGALGVAMRSRRKLAAIIA
jgi:hypothetical protein